jgi:hypothetical protein
LHNSFTKSRVRKAKLSKLQKLLDLDHPVGKEFITAHDLCDRWRKDLPLDYKDSNRADGGETTYCDAHLRHHMVDITEHTLDGKSFNRRVLV